MKPVLFASFRPLPRAENIQAIFNAYDGPKEFLCTTSPIYRDAVTSGKYDVMVIDDFPDVSPGKCIMIWHAIHGGKKIGLDQPGRPYYDGSKAHLMTYVIASGTGTQYFWHSCTGVRQSRILPLGLPCTDAYVGKHKGDGGTSLAEYRAYLYVPTFRDKGEPPAPEIDYAMIDSMLNDDELFVVKRHPWHYYQNNEPALTLGAYRHIIEVPGTHTTTPYLIDCDVVVTDYSSVIFDGYLLDKPCVLFDRNTDYVTERGMYFQYPFDYIMDYMVTDEQSLIRKCRQKYNDGLSYMNRILCDIVADSCDGHACERLTKLIHDLNGGEHP